MKVSSYSDGGGLWDGADDPFKLLNASAAESKEHEFTQSRKQELIKEIFDLRQQLESKECANEELKKKNSELSLKCETYLAPEDVRGYRDELQRLRTENTDIELQKQSFEHKLQKAESENRVLKQQLEEQAGQSGRFKTELTATKAQLEREMTRQVMVVVLFPYLFVFQFLLALSDPVGCGAGFISSRIARDPFFGEEGPFSNKIIKVVDSS